MYITTQEGIMSQQEKKSASKSDKERGIKRYNLSLPEEIMKELQAAADANDTTVLELLRRFVKLGLIALELEKREDAALIIREGDREREIILL
jgi:hypothetical protein